VQDNVRQQRPRLRPPARPPARALRRFAAHGSAAWWLPKACTPHREGSALRSIAQPSPRHATPRHGRPPCERVKAEIGPTVRSRYLYSAARRQSRATAPADVVSPQRAAAAPGRARRCCWSTRWPCSSC
jgi:hypothetical protein